MTGDAGTKWTPGPWKFEPMGAYTDDAFMEFERLTGKTKPEHEKYFRDNNGDWAIGFDGGRVATATFRGTAKRGQGYNAPDPEGMANARLISAAPELYKALERIISELPTKRDWLDPTLEASARAALRQARGEK